jgi:ribosomal protein L44E
MVHMKLIDMKTKCRMCGKDLIADDKDEDFATFYCMKCGVYTTKPIEDFKEEPKPVPAPDAVAVAKPEEKKA